MLDIKRKGVTKCSNMVENILPAEPAPPPRHKKKVSKGLNLNLSEHGHDAYQIKGNHKCSNMVANILSVDPPSTLGMGLIGQNSFFSKHGHVAYQIKWNHEMQQHGSKFFARRPSPSPNYPRGRGQKVTIQLFQNMVIAHIKLGESRNAATW